MKLNTIIIDDEANARENLQILINDYCPTLNVVGMASNVNQAKILINQFNPEVVFLDIAMPGGDGFSLLDQYDDRKFSVVFTTAHSEYALKAYKADAIDYIQKPIDIDELQKAQEKVMKLSNLVWDDKHKNQATTEDEIAKIAIPTRSGYIFIENKDILYFKASENYTEIFLTSGKRIISSKTIKRYEEKVSPHIFYRVHKSFIINKHNHLKELSRQMGNFAVMTNGEHIPIARRRLTDFMKEIA
ncbi:LytTR family DNA-binding domain-containing protein [Flavobacteriales bacterium]|nr:LytTR family DNA-binding domain-containing protein [Flavobacteriales bacterium]